MWPLFMRPEGDFFLFLAKIKNLMLLKTYKKGPHRKVLEKQDLI